MATRRLLVELAAACRQQTGISIVIESVGGVDAANRVMAGEAFDVVVLASDAIDKLIASGHVMAGSKTGLVKSAVAVAVRDGAARPDAGNETSLRQAILSARNIGYSTGPSGTALLKLFERWGIAMEMNARLVQSPAGMPVGQMVAEGKVELGFQQLSELAEMPGIEIIGMMPAGCEISTTFSAGVCAVSKHADAARKILSCMQAKGMDEIKRRHYMEPVS